MIWCGLQGRRRLRWRPSTGPRHNHSNENRPTSAVRSSKLPSRPEHRSETGLKEEHMHSYKIAAMGGDGIGPEVVDAGVRVLNVCAERDGRFTLDFQDFDWGSDYYRKHGVMMPRDGADQLRKFDAILFGAVGGAVLPDSL